MKQRCAWVGDSAIYRDYHDYEWGKPEYDSRKLFEQLCLEGQQAGLSWITVLKKREHYRCAFHQFQPEKIARMDESDIDGLMQNEGLIRHRAKLQAVVKNARAYLEMQRQGEDFGRFVWAFADYRPYIRAVASPADVPAATEVSRTLSRALKKKGFVFVGATTCYAFMQAAGLVDDHWDGCFCKHRTPLAPSA